MYIFYTLVKYIKVLYLYFHIINTGTHVRQNTEHIIHVLCNHRTDITTTLHYHVTKFMLQVDRTQNMCDMYCATIENHRRHRDPAVIIVITSSSPSPPTSYSSPTPHPTPHPSPHPSPPPKTNFANRSQDPKATSQSRPWRSSMTVSSLLLVPPRKAWAQWVRSLRVGLV